MAHSEPASPYFSPTEPRPLAPDERAVVERMAQNLGTYYKVQLAGLKVVGRCGCGGCPTIFFMPRTKGDREYDIASGMGTDSSGGHVGVVLLEKNGQLSQLESFFVDAHDPLSMPIAASLETY